MGIIRSKNKKEKRDRVEVAKEKTLKRIESFKKHLSKKSLEDSSIQFFHIVRFFFADLFKIRYEFTFEELDSELKKRKADENLKEKITIFLKKISAVEYSDEKLSQREIQDLFEEFKEIFKKLTTKQEKSKNKGNFSFLKNIFSRKKKDQPDKKKSSFLIKLKSRADDKRKKKIHKMLLKELELVNKDKIEEGKKLYAKIKEEYNLLNNEDKKDFCSALNELNGLFEEFDHLYKKDKHKAEAAKDINPSMEPKLRESKRRKKKIQNMLIRAFDLVKKNKIEDGKKIYVTIKEEYNLLDNDDKKRVYPNILTLYNELVSKKDTTN
ncbi:MAG: hypothetical protein PHV16_02800 [Candidatus Nanoarchaeia archaeon]|nr:hypothetical protein [Candidatus Nanoarchaeia archaeon]